MLVCLQLEVEECEGKGHRSLPGVGLCPLLTPEAEHSHALTGCFSQLQPSAGCVKHDSIVPYAHI